MPRSKVKQKLIDTRNATYREVSANVCANCVHFWPHCGTSCQLEPARYRDEIDHCKPVVPWGTCDLFEAKGE